VEVEQVDLVLLLFDVLYQFMQEKLADLDISPRQMHYHLQNGLVLVITLLMSRGKNVMNAFWGQESGDMVLWEIVQLGILLID